MLNLELTAKRRGWGGFTTPALWDFEHIHKHKQCIFSSRVVKINYNVESEFSSGTYSNPATSAPPPLDGWTRRWKQKGFEDFYRRRGANLQMIKKTHSVKCVGDTRDSEGSLKAWERLTVKIDGRRRTEADMVTTKVHRKARSAFYAAFIYIHYKDADTNRGDGSLRNLRLICVNMGRRIRVNICLYPLVGSLKCHQTRTQYWKSIGNTSLMWNGGCSLSTQTFLFSNAPGELLNSHYPFLLGSKYWFSLSSFTLCIRLLLFLLWLWDSLQRSFRGN